MISTENSFQLFPVVFPHLPIISIPKAILAGTLEECTSIFRQAANYQPSLLNSLVTKATEMIILSLGKSYVPTCLLLASTVQVTVVNASHITFWKRGSAHFISFLF